MLWPHIWYMYLQFRFRTRPLTEPGVNDPLIDGASPDGDAMGCYGMRPAGFCPRSSRSHDTSQSIFFRRFECEPEVNWLFRKMIDSSNQSNVRAVEVFTWKTSQVFCYIEVTSLASFWKSTGDSFTGRRTAWAWEWEINPHLLGLAPLQPHGLCNVAGFLIDVYVSICVHPLDIS